jgi:hypothetical protein
MAFGSIYTLGLSLLAIIYPSLDKILFLKIYKSKKIKKSQKIFILFLSVLLPLYLIQSISLSIFK